MPTEPPESEPPSASVETSEATRARSTYKWDLIRGAGQGATETCWQVFALLIAIRVFSADESIKQFIPAGTGIGLMLSPLGLSIANRINRPVASIIAYTWIGVAISLGGMVISSSIILFVLCIACAQVSASQSLPLLTHLYSTNYPPTERGSRLSTTALIASFTGISFGYLGGRLLDWKVDSYSVLFAAGIFTALLVAFASSRFPSEPAHTLQSRNPLSNLAIAWTDRLFGMMLMGWMLMGLGNMMLVPIRVEYLANPVYGINASNAQITVLLISVVFSFRLLSTKVWGYLFDRVNVVTIRISLNLVFIASIIFFFFTDRLWLMAVGCALLGTAFGGGGILWTLYVTKIAPPEKVSSYMSVHVFLTGFRSTLAPFIGYSVVEYSHPILAAWIALVLIGISTVLFIPLKPLIEAKAESLGKVPYPRIDSPNRA